MHGVAYADAKDHHGVSVCGGVDEVAQLQLLDHTRRRRPVTVRRTVRGGGGGARRPTVSVTRGGYTSARTARPRDVSADNTWASCSDTNARVCSARIIPMHDNTARH